MYANEVGVGVQKLVWDGLWGWGMSSCWKDIFDIPPCSKVTKNLARNKGVHQKMTTVTKFAPPHLLSWHSESSPWSDLSSKMLCCERQERNCLKKRKGKKKGKTKGEIRSGCRS